MKRVVLLIGLMLVFSLVFGVAAGAEPNFVWPVKGEVITSFNVGDNQYEAGQHRGIDISASVGDEVVAVAEGTVTYAARNPQGGYMITIDHPSGLSTTYLGLGEKGVGRGQTVSAGQRIGKIGLEGDPSTERPHLHLGVYETATRSNKVYRDPLLYLPPFSAESELASQPSTSPVAQGSVPDSSAPEPGSSSPEEVVTAQPVPEEMLGPVVSESVEKLVVPSSPETVNSSQPVQTLPEEKISTKEEVAVAISQPLLKSDSASSSSQVGLKSAKKAPHSAQNFLPQNGLSSLLEQGVEESALSQAEGQPLSSGEENLGDASNHGLSFWRVALLAAMVLVSAWYRKKTRGVHPVF